MNEFDPGMSLKSYLASLMERKRISQGKDENANREIIALMTAYTRNT